MGLWNVEIPTNLVVIYSIYTFTKKCMFEVTERGQVLCFGTEIFYTVQIFSEGLKI